MDFKLIIKKLNNTLTKKEATTFSDWYNESDQHKDYFKKVKQNYRGDDLLVDVDKGWKSIEKKIKPTATKKNNYIKYAVAATVLLLVGLGSLVYKTSFDEHYITEKAIEKIKPGFEKATLVLEDGVAVNLEKNNVTISSNDKALVKNTTAGLVFKSKGDVALEKDVQIKYNTLHVPIGGIYNVELSDGTIVWLNSSSTLKFPTNFSGDQRVVTLEGEAYFDVTKSDKEFIVNAGTAEIAVLGTEFNVTSYPNSNEFFTTLVEGKVRMTGKENSVILEPNQQGFATNAFATVEVKTVDVKMFTAWKEGKFYFKKQPLEQILTKMNRWYNVDVLFDEETIKNETFTGVVLKNKPIDYLLNIICETTSLTYTINKNEKTEKYEIKIARK